MGVLDSVTNFVDKVGSQINITFKAIDDFLDSVITFFVTSGYWVSVLTFFLLFILIIYIPLLLFKYWTSIKEQYSLLTEKMVSSISSK